MNEDIKKHKSGKRPRTFLREAGGKRKLYLTEDVDVLCQRGYTRCSRPGRSARIGDSVCVKDNKGQIKRLKRVLANALVKKGDHTFCSKTQWKAWLKVQESQNA